MTKVTLIPGDGIGPEVSGAATKVVDALDEGIEWDEHEAGATAVERHGTPLPPAVLDSIKDTGVALKPQVPQPASM